MPLRVPKENASSLYNVHKNTSQTLVNYVNFVHLKYSLITITFFHNRSVLIIKKVVD